MSKYHRDRYLKRSSTLEARTFSRIVCVDGHWIWQGKPNNGGHGQIDGHPAHRIVWELLVGPLAPGAILHHTCEIKLCVRPMCMEETNHAGNMARMSQALSPRKKRTRPYYEGVDA